MARLQAKAALPHLVAALIVCGVAAALLFLGRTIAVHLERSTLAWTAATDFPLKNQGLAFQRAAARAPDVLPLYGSSEFFSGGPARANSFFHTAPTGFRVSPVGKPGSDSVIMLQKLGALGGDLRGKKLAISISATWFTVPDTTLYWYRGNFSPLAASELVFGTALDFNLKRDIASRILQFPQTLAKSPLLEFALRRLASGGVLDRIVFSALWPLGKIQNAILDFQDHFASVIYILHEAKPAGRAEPQMLDWPSLIGKAGEAGGADDNENGKASGSDKQTVASRSDPSFCQRLNKAREWVDLELLLRVLTEIHAQPLLLSMPMDGPFYDKAGISRSVRECYYRKIRMLAQRYNFALVDFEQHDKDSAFLNHENPRLKHVPSAHLTAKGWIFYDRVLDDFFHGRVPQP
jgi:D-alanine transfer protein